MALVATIAATDADSYVTLAEYQAHATARGWTLAGTDAADEANLRRAAQMMDATYHWIGTQQYQFQARSWPRLVRGLVDGWPVDPDTIPGAIKSAQMEIAHELQLGNDPAAVTDGSVQRRREKVGDLEREIEYAGGVAPVRLPMVDRILRDYVLGGAGQVRVTRA